MSENLKNDPYSVSFRPKQFERSVRRIEEVNQHLARNKSEVAAFEKLGVFLEPYFAVRREGIRTHESERDSLRKYAERCIRLVEFNVEFNAELEVAVPKPPGSLGALLGHFAPAHPHAALLQTMRNMYRAAESVGDGLHAVPVQYVAGEPKFGVNVFGAQEHAGDAVKPKAPEPEPAASK